MEKHQLTKTIFDYCKDNNIELFIDIPEGNLIDATQAFIDALINGGHHSAGKHESSYIKFKKEYKTLTKMDLCELKNGCKPILWGDIIFTNSGQGILTHKCYTTERSNKW